MKEIHNRNNIEWWLDWLTVILWPIGVGFAGYIVFNGWMNSQITADWTEFEKQFFPIAIPIAGGLLCWVALLRILLPLVDKKDK